MRRYRFRPSPTDAPGTAARSHVLKRGFPLRCTTLNPCWTRYGRMLHDRLSAAPSSEAHVSPDRNTYHLELYTAGRRQRAETWKTALQRALEQAGRYGVIEIIDITENLDLATERRVFATPTLIRLRPRPEVRLLGDLSDPHTLLPLLGFGGEPPLKR